MGSSIGKNHRYSTNTELEDAKRCTRCGLLITTRRLWNPATNSTNTFRLAWNSESSESNGDEPTYYRWHDKLPKCRDINK